MPSYADYVREELLELAIKRPCCKKALTCGLLLTATAENGEISVIYRHAATAEMACKEMRRQFGKMPRMEVCSAYGHIKYHVSFASAAAEKLLCEMGGGSDAEESAECEGCRSAFLRGAFLSCGTMVDPHKSTHMEFLLQDDGRAQWLRNALGEIGYEPRVTNRKNEIGLYFKDLASVEDLVALMGAGKKSMEIMNLRIERDIRNQENRATNCVTKNIEKSVSASAKQMDAIEKLILSGMLAQLPDSIRLTARLRAENPDASLEELRNLHVPPITKSGLNHRLQKILAEADKLD